MQLCQLRQPRLDLLPDSPFLHKHLAPLWTDFTAIRTCSQIFIFFLFQFFSVLVFITSFLFFFFAF